MLVEETATTRTYVCDYCGTRSKPVKTIGKKTNTNPGWIWIHSLKTHVACACPNKKCQEKIYKQYLIK